jgi:putative oxidoreductase
MSGDIAPEREVFERLARSKSRAGQAGLRSSVTRRPGVATYSGNKESPMTTYELTPLRSRIEKNVAFLPLRASLGATMVHHGWSKLAGEGPQQTGQFMEQLNIRPAKPAAVALGVSEIFAGLSAILGIATRPAALAVLVTQGVAIWKVHAKKGFDVSQGGFEFNAALIAIAAGLLIAGPGLFSAHEGVERLTEGRGARRLFRKARPGLGLRLLKWLK